MTGLGTRLHELFGHPAPPNHDDQTPIAGSPPHKEVTSNPQRSHASQLPEHAAYLPDCNKVPQALHPHSYHSSFGFNTNVWLTRSSAVNSSGVASVAPLTFNPAKEYFLPNNVAMSRNWCGWYKPEELLAQRCPCVEGTPCAAASKAVEAAAREGKLAPYPVPSEKFKHERVEAW